MTKVFFVRHCEPNYKNHDDFLRELTKKGLKNIKYIEKFFVNKKVDLIFSSPYIRTIQTILGLSNKLNIKIEENYNFIERKVSDKWIDNFDDFSKKQWEDFEFKLKNGESLIEVQNRNIVALKSIIDANVEKNIIICGHVCSISTVLNYYDNKFFYDNYSKIKDKFPFIVELEFLKTDFKSYKIYTLENEKFILK